MRKTIRGFTIIELLIVIAVMGILTTIGLVSFARIQSDARDSQRNSKTTAISEALEKYYEENGEYPSCSAMAAASNTVTTTTLKGLDPNILTAPKANSGINSILAACADLSSTDAFAYIGQSCNANRCQKYTLKYREEGTGNSIELISRHDVNLPGPATPGSLAAFVGSSTTINVSWMAAPDATSYTLQRDTNISFPSPAVTTQPELTTQSSGLSQGIKYYYRVLAENLNGQSAWSATINATTTIDTPAAPVVTANTVAGTTTWSWPAVSCPAGTADIYQYRYTITPSFDSGWTEPTDPEALSIDFDTSLTGHTYTVEIQALCQTAETSSDWSASGSDDYTRVAPPSSPSNLVATTASSTSVNVSWDAVNGATSYTLHRDTNSLFPSPTIVTQAGITYLSSGLSQGVKYYYRVLASASGLDSDWSTTANATTTIDTPAAPVVTANTVADTTTWSWPAVSCAAGTSARYQYRYTITPSGSDSGWVGPTSSPVAFSTNTRGQTYTVAVQAQCYTTDASSAWSASGQASYFNPGWYNASWNYRKRITLSGATGVVADYQVLIAVGESSGSSGYGIHLEANGKTDFSDVRFTSADGTTALSYWVESKSGTTPNQTAKIWVEVAEVLTVSRDIYIYYGNGAATDTSSIADTFIIGDNFSNASLDTGKWSVTKSGTGTVNIVSQTLETRAPSGLGATAGIVSVNAFNLANKSYQTSTLTNSGKEEWLYISQNRTTTSNPNNINYWYRVGTDRYSGNFLVQRRLTSLTTQYSTPASQFGNNKFRIRYDGTTIYFDVDYNSTGTWVNKYSEAYGIGAGNVYAYVYTYDGLTGYSGYVYFDNVFMRQYVNSEPALSSAGTQEAK